MMDQSILWRTRGEVHSQTRKKVVNGHLQRAGDPHERIDRDGFLPSLDLPDVVAVQIRFLRQGFLRIAAAFSMGADRLTNNPAMFRTSGGHATYGNRQPSVLLPSIACILDLQFGRFPPAMPGSQFGVRVGPPSTCRPPFCFIIVCPNVKATAEI